MATYSQKITLAPGESKTVDFSAAVDPGDQLVFSVKATNNRTTSVTKMVTLTVATYSRPYSAP